MKRPGDELLRVRREAVERRSVPCDSELAPSNVSADRTRSRVVRTRRERAPATAIGELLPPDAPACATGLGGTAAFTITVRNSAAAGTGTATDVTMTDTLPAGLSWSESEEKCTIDQVDVEDVSHDLASVSPGTPSRSNAVMRPPTMLASLFSSEAPGSRQSEWFGTPCHAAMTV